MSNLYTNLPNLSLGNNGADSATFTSSSISVGTVNCTSIVNTGSISNTGPIANPSEAVTTTANITALSSSKGFVYLSGTTATNVKGIAAGVDGQHLTIYNASTQNMTITAQSTAAATAAKIIILGTATTAVTSGIGIAELIYSGTASRWILKYLTA